MNAPMTSPTQPAASQPNVATAISRLYNLMLRSLLTKGRLLGMGALGLLAVVVAAVAGRGDFNVERNTTEFLAFYGMALMVPLICLLLGTSALGNFIEDRLLVYLWLKPLPRWYLAVAAFLATFTLSIPLAVIPLTLAAALSGISDLIVPTFMGALVGCLAYCGLFVALGTRFARGLWWGLLYILIWENLLSSISDGTARLSIKSYPFSIMERAMNVNLDLAGRAAWATVAIPVLVAIAGTAYAGRRLAIRDIE